MHRGNSNAKGCVSNKSGPERRQTHQTKFIRAVTLTLSDTGITIYVGSMGPTDQTHSLRLGTEPSSDEGLLRREAEGEGTTSERAMEDLALAVASSYHDNSMAPPTY